MHIKINLWYTIICYKMKLCKYFTYATLLFDILYFVKYEIASGVFCLMYIFFCILWWNTGLIW